MYSPEPINPSAQMTATVISGTRIARGFNKDSRAMRIRMDANVTPPRTPCFIAISPPKYGRLKPGIAVKYQARHAGSRIAPVRSQALDQRTSRSRVAEDPFESVR